MTVSARTAALLAVTGAVMVAAFFMPWAGIAGFNEVSGFDIATAGDWLSRSMLLFAVPLAGAALAYAALRERDSARTAALIAGAVVFVPTLYYLGKGLVFGTSWGLWMVVVGGAWLMVLAAARKPEPMIVPGLMIVAGFFLPWTTTFGELASWGITGFDIARLPSAPFELGLPSPKLAYLVPLAGVAGLVGGLVRTRTGTRAGGIAGLVAVGSIIYFVVRTFAVFAGWGLWATAGAAAAALLLAARKA